MTIFNNNNPSFKSQAVTTDKSVEQDNHRKLLVDVETDEDKIELVFDQNNVDRKLFKTICELFYGRVKMEVLDNPNVEDNHAYAVDKTCEVISSIELTKFNEENAKEFLNARRGRKQGNTED